MAMNGDLSLRGMVLTFRVAELQSLLKYAGEEHVRLRKKELQKKALKLISKKRFAKKIKSIYSKMMGSSSEDENFVPSDLEDCFDDFKGYFDENQFPAYDDYLDGCSNSFSDNYFSQSRAEDQYFAMFTKNLDMKRLSNVQFRNLTFFDYKSDILSITPLIPKKQEDDFFSFDKTFTLNQEATNALFSERSPYKAVIRFCVLNNEMEVSDYLPTLLSVKVNREICALPPSASSVSKINSVKRFAPVDITPNLEKNKYINSLSVEWSVDYYTLYGIVIQLMRRYTSEELITKLKAKGERDASFSKKFIYDSLNEDDDNEISATTLKMSLICPIGKMPITLPTRATTCNHLQCFDGCSYIQINELKSTWICPVCSQTCFYEDLFIDGYFTEILRSDKFLPDIRDVELDPDGSWRPVRATERTKRPSKNFAIVPDDVAGIEHKAEVECKNNAVEDGNDAHGMINTLIDLLQQYDSSNNPRSDILRKENSPAVHKLPPLCPIPSGTDSVPRDLREKISQPESSSNHKRKSDSPQKKVLLVDLTMSDSESDDIKSISDDIKSISDDIKSISSGSQMTWSPTISSPNYDLQSSSPIRSTDSPPIYDIDSDSSFSS